MLHNYFHSQATHTKKTNERIQRLNEKTNSKIKPPANFNTQFVFPQNAFFANLANLKEVKKDEEGMVILHPGIKVIHNVYQPSFANMQKSTGFGDFVRGCLYVLEFCEKHNKACDFHINHHHIKKYLNYFIDKPELPPAIARNIHKYLELNAEFITIHNKIEYRTHSLNDSLFIHYLNACTNYLGNIYMNTTNFPLHQISQKNKDFMRRVLEPTHQLLEEVDRHMSELKLVKQNFITYHIRLGDSYLNNPTNTVVHNQLIQYIIKKMTLRPQHDYLLITDSSIFKKIIVSYFQHINIKCIFFDISHTCENDDASIKNTLVEFYMMSHSKAIISMSVYPHGSGFSKWCSVVYSIPYVCYLLPKP